VTRQPSPVILTGSGGHALTFWDMPGIGESAGADERHLRMYAAHLDSSDVAIWAVHADSRSTAYDELCLARLLDAAPPGRRRALLSKLTFVLTKADLLIPPPWVFDLRGDSGSFVPTGELAARLERKAAYHEGVLFAPRGGLLGATTYNDGTFDVTDEALTVDTHAVHYRGHFTRPRFEEYRDRFPAHEDVFRRLRDNHRVLPCSALFRFNLAQLLVVIVNKLGFGAVARFRKVLRSAGGLDSVSVETMRGFGNIVVWDGRAGRKRFDLTETQW
jgi:hypothetical protein